MEQTEQTEKAVEAKTTGLTITKERLREWQACSSGYAWFLNRFPQGSDYGNVQAALRKDGRSADATRPRACRCPRCATSATST